MIDTSIIFSEKKGDRIKRHLLFWGVWWLYFGLLHAMNPFGRPEISYFRNLPFTILESFFLISTQPLLAYPLMYFVLPRFVFKGKYLKAFLWTIVFVVISTAVSAYVMKGVTRTVLASILPPVYLQNTERSQAQLFFIGLLGNLKGGLTASAIAACLKLLKHWYIKDRRNLQLQKDNAEAQMQLLTAQVHPHFLFNTLNNIYSRAQLESPGSAKMIMELSHILRYVLEEAKHDVVPLENEIQMITDYINLEKMRYDDKLDLYIALPEKTEGVYIAPLILLPFVENCFKHGASKMADNPWVNLKIEIRDDYLQMKLMNGKKELPAVNNRKGTGIDNVRQRLQLLYEERFRLQITDEEDVFVVNLEVPVIRREMQPATQHLQPQPHVYV